MTFSEMQKLLGSDAETLRCYTRNGAFETKEKD
jgi:hypothetical protein